MLPWPEGWLSVGFGVFPNCRDPTYSILLLGNDVAAEGFVFLLDQSLEVVVAHRRAHLVVLHLAEGPLDFSL